MDVEDGPPIDAGTLRWRAGDLLPGGRYRIEREIGSWGIRAVYSIVDTVTDQPALLCVLAAVGSGEIAERVARLTALEHPFLPVIREYVLRDEALVLVLQEADGAALDCHLAASPNTPVAERIAVDWGIQIAEGLAFLHRQEPPLVAADLAPAALLVTPFGRIKLLGLGPLLGLFTAAGLVGALEQRYAAPEVYAGELSQKSDIYALGALLLRAVSGERSGAVTTGALDSVRAPDVELLPELAEAIEKAMQLAPEARWQSAAEFAAALREIAVRLEARADAVNSSLEATAPPRAESGALSPAEVPGGEHAPQTVPESIVADAPTALTALNTVTVGVNADSPSPAQTDTLSPATPGGIRGLLGGLFRSRRSKTQDA